MVAKDGLLIVKQSQPFLPQSELIVIPLHLLHGLLTSLHIILNHPTMHQLTNVFNRCYFSINVNDCISKVTKSCSQCQSLETMPKELFPQSSSLPPITPLCEYAADCMHRCRQIIFVIRDTFSSFTIAQIISDEKHGTLRSAVVIAVSSIRPNPQTLVEVRVDNNSGFVKLKDDNDLNLHKINITFGRIHNKNKIPTVDKGIRELSSEILRLYPEGGPVTDAQLAVAVNQLNSRIRNRGLSAWEILNQRDQFTGEQFDIDDLKLSEQQSDLRAANQLYSATHKAGGKSLAKSASVTNGSLVYIKSEGDKHTARSRYLVVDVCDDFCTLQKFVKSQLRAKKYQLKLCEVYPIQSENIEIEGDIRELDVGNDVDYNDEDEIYTETHNLVENPANRSRVDTGIVDSPQHTDVVIDSSVDTPVIPMDNCTNNNIDVEVMETVVATPHNHVHVVETVDTPSPDADAGLVAARPKRKSKKPEDPNFVYY